MSEATLHAPEKLAAHHDLSDFDSGVAVLDDWLRRRARQNEAAGASRTYVIRSGRKVAGYYSLAAGAVAHEMVPGPCQSASFACAWHGDGWSRRVLWIPQFVFPA